MIFSGSFNCLVTSSLTAALYTIICNARDNMRYSCFHPFLGYLKFVFYVIFMSMLCYFLFVAMQIHVILFI